jgi:hypothetical protein
VSSEESGIPGLEIGPEGGGGGLDFVVSFLSDIVGGFVDAINAIISVLNALGPIVASIVDFLGKLWTKILKPFFKKIEALIARLHRIYNRILKPILDQIAKQRRFIRRIYEIYFRPVLETIQALRLFLALTRLNQTAFGRALDRRLSSLEAKVAAPITAALRTINDQARMLNVILGVDLLFQDVTHIRSIVKSLGGIENAFLNLSRVRATGLRDAIIETIPTPATAAADRQAFGDLLTSSSGAFAENYSADNTTFRRMLAAP